MARLEEVRKVRDDHIMSFMVSAWEPNLLLDPELWDNNANTKYEENFHPQPEDQEPLVDAEIVTGNSRMDEMVLTSTALEICSTVCMLNTKK